MTLGFEGQLRWLDVALAMLLVAGLIALWAQHGQKVKTALARARQHRIDYDKGPDRCG